MSQRIQITKTGWMNIGTGILNKYCSAQDQIIFHGKFLKMQYYVIIDNKTDLFIALNESFGGYPYGTDELNKAKLFIHKLRAKEYRNLFPKEDWSLRSVIISADPVSWE